MIWYSSIICFGLDCSFQVSLKHYHILSYPNYHALSYHILSYLVIPYHTLSYHSIYHILFYLILTYLINTRNNVFFLLQTDSLYTDRSVFFIDPPLRYVRFLLQLLMPLHVQLEALKTEGVHAGQHLWGDVHLVAQKTFGELFCHCRWRHNSQPGVHRRRRAIGRGRGWARPSTVFHSAGVSLGGQLPNTRKSICFAGDVRITIHPDFEKCHEKLK